MLLITCRQCQSLKAAEAAVWRCFRLGASGCLEFQFGKRGPGQGVGLGKELPFLLGGKSVLGTLSGHPGPCPWGRGLHSQGSGWPEISSLAVRTASPGSSAAHPDNTRKTEGSVHMGAESSSFSHSAMT